MAKTRKIGGSDWLGLKTELSPNRKALLTALSFIIPLVLWCIISYVPFVWHPLVRITDPADVDSFSSDMEVPVEVFSKENNEASANHLNPAKGYRVNPVYLPAPDAVARAFYTAFVTPPRLTDEPWLHQSLWHSMQVIFWGFALSSVIGVPIGILCGTFRFFSSLTEPFIEFFRYLPAPAFGALCVAVLGIDDGPKIALIFIGTFFQQVLVIANTVRKMDPALIEAAQTLGANGWKLVWKVVIPSTMVDIYTDLRILLGWAWTYLIVAEVVGASSGITLFINMQARYRIFENVYAAIFMIGIIGFTVDSGLAFLGILLFPWKRRGGRPLRISSLLKPFTAKPAPEVEGQGLAEAKGHS